MNILWAWLYSWSHFHWLNIIFQYMAIFYLFILDALGLCCYVWASHCGGFSGCRAQVQVLWCICLIALQHVGSSQTRGWTYVPCIARWILNHWTTREVQGYGSIESKWKMSMKTIFPCSISQTPLNSKLMEKQ